MNSYYAAAERARASTSCTTPRSSALDVARRRGSTPRTVRDRRRARRRFAPAPWCSRPADSSRTSSGCARSGASAADNFIIRGTPYNTGTLLRLMLDAGAQPVGDPRAVPRGRRRRPRAEVRRRHRHAARLRAARHRRQHARRALLRRGRGLLAEALRDLGQARRAAAGSDRVFDHRRQGGRPVHAVGVSADRGRLDPRAGGAAGPARRRARGDRRRVQRARCGPARSITRCSTTAAPTG